MGKRVTNAIAAEVREIRACADSLVGIGVVSGLVREIVSGEVPREDVGAAWDDVAACVEGARAYAASAVAACRRIEELVRQAGSRATAVPVEVDGLADRPRYPSAWAIVAVEDFRRIGEVLQRVCERGDWASATRSRRDAIGEIVERYATDAPSLDEKGAVAASAAVADIRRLAGEMGEIAGDAPGVAGDIVSFCGELDRVIGSASEPAGGR